MSNFTTAIDVLGAAPPYPGILSSVAARFRTGARLRPDPRDVIVNARKVTVMPKGRAAEVFEAPVLIEVRGAERRPAAWDKNDSMYYAPASVTVKLRDGSIRRFANPEDAYVSGGNARTVIIGAYGDGWSPDNWKPAPSLKDVRSGKELIYIGMRGPAVEYIQAIVGVVADGKFGNDTEDAVISFRFKYGLKNEPLGAVGKETMAVIDDIAKNGIRPTVAPVPSASAVAQAATSRLIQEASAAKQQAIAPVSTSAKTAETPVWKYAIGGVAALALGLGAYKVLS